MGSESGRSSGEWRAWLALRSVRGVGAVAFRALLQAFGSPADALSAGRRALIAAGLRSEAVDAITAFDDWALVDDQIARLEHAGAWLATLHDGSYPANLRQIRDAPPFLFVQGDL